MNIKTARTRAHWLTVAGVVNLGPSATCIVVGAAQSERWPLALGIVLTWTTIILFATALRLAIWPHTDFRDGRCLHCAARPMDDA